MQVVDWVNFVWLPFPRSLPLSTPMWPVHYMPMSCNTLMHLQSLMSLCMFLFEGIYVLLSCFHCRRLPITLLPGCICASVLLPNLMLKLPFSLWHNVFGFWLTYHNESQDVIVKSMHHSLVYLLSLEYLVFGDVTSVKYQPWATLWFWLCLELEVVCSYTFLYLSCLSYA